MSPLAIVLRWAMAFPAVLLCWIAGLTAGSAASRGLGAGIDQAAMAGSACATLCGVLAGSLAAPPRHRRAASWLFIVLPIALWLYTILAADSAAGLALRHQLGLLGAVIGGVLGLVAIRVFFPIRDGALGQHAGTIRWIVALTLVIPVFVLTHAGLGWLLLRLRGGPESQIWVVAASTAAAAVAGLIIVPRQQRIQALWVFAGAPGALMLLAFGFSAYRGHIHADDLLALAGVEIGCFFASWATRTRLAHVA